jgi:hypothetical protein
MAKRPLVVQQKQTPPLLCLPSEVQCLVVTASGLDIFAWQCTAHHFRNLVAAECLFQKMAEFGHFHREDYPHPQCDAYQLTGQRLVTLQPRFLVLHHVFVPSADVLVQLAPSLISLRIMDPDWPADDSLRLSSVLPALTNLRSLEIMASPPREWAYLGPALTKLQQLEQLCYVWRYDDLFGEGPLCTCHSFAYLSHLTALRHLDLCGDHDGVGYEHISMLRRLEVLSMRNSQIDSRLNTLPALTALHSLDRPSAPGYRPLDCVEKLEPRIKLFVDSAVPMACFTEPSTVQYYWPLEPLCVCGRHCGTTSDTSDYDDASACDATDDNDV